MEVPTPSLGASVLSTLATQTTTSSELPRRPVVLEKHHAYCKRRRPPLTDSQAPCRHLFGPVKRMSNGPPSRPTSPPPDELVARGTVRKTARQTSRASIQQVPVTTWNKDHEAWLRSRDSVKRKATKVIPRLLLPSRSRHPRGRADGHRPSHQWSRRSRLRCSGAWLHRLPIPRPCMLLRRP